MRAWLAGAVAGFLWAGTASGATDGNPLYDGCMGRLNFKIDQRLAACDDAIASQAFSGIDLARLYLLRSAVWIAKDNSANAQADMEAAFKTSPAIFDQVADLASKYNVSKQYDFTLKLLDHADSLLPHSPPFLYERAYALYYLHQWDLAKKEIDEAIRLDPGRPNSIWLRAGILSATGDTDGALAELDDLVKRDPGDPALHNSRCYLRAVVGRELDKALADCDAALKINPNDPAVLDSRGLVYLRMNRFAESIADYSAAIAISDHPSAATFYGRGLAEQHSGNSMSASADFGAAEALSPGIGKKFNTIAMLAE